MSCFELEVVEEESVGVVEVLLLFYFELFLLTWFQWRHSGSADSEKKE